MPASPLSDETLHLIDAVRTALSHSSDVEERTMPVRIVRLGPPRAVDEGRQRISAHRFMAFLASSA